MAIQDDIVAMLSQVSDGGNRATSAGEEGKEMYGRISELITDKDNMYAAQRELGPLFDPMQFGSLEEQMRQDPLTGGSVADIIRKYMDDAGDGVPIPSDMIVDDTRPAESAMLGTFNATPIPKPEVPIVRPELAPLPASELDAAGISGLLDGSPPPPSIAAQLEEMAKAVGKGATDWYDKSGKDYLNQQKTNIRARSGTSPEQGPDLNNRDSLQYAEKQGLNADITQSAAESARTNRMVTDDMLSDRNFEDVLRSVMGETERPSRRAQTTAARLQEKFVNDILLRRNAGEISQEKAMEMIQRAYPSALKNLQKSGMMAPVPRQYSAPAPPPAQVMRADGGRLRSNIMNTYRRM